jgi:N-acetylmuramoyl-L-alanine amidase
MQSTAQLPVYSDLETPLSITASKYNPFVIIACLFLSVFLLSAAPKPDSTDKGYVPLLMVIEYFDYDYRFAAATGTLTIYHGNGSMTYVIGSREVYAGDEVLFLQKQLELREGVIYAHPETVDMFVFQATGRHQMWSFDGQAFSMKAAGSRNVDRKPGSASAGATTAARRQRESRGSKSSNEIGDINTIIIDAGHGGKDPGGIGHNQLYEKDIVLDVAKELRKDLHRRFRRKEILLTRSDDTFISLEDRGEMANSIDPGKNPIFISIHANVSFSSKTKGYETFYLSLEAMGDDAREVAARENSVLDFEIENSDDYVSEIINRLVDIEYRRESMRMAEYIQEGIERYVDSGSENRGVKSAFFYVLKESKMPAVLVEIGFLTNEAEAELLQKDEYQKRIVSGVADGIEEFITAFEETEGFTRQYELARE